MENRNIENNESGSSVEFITPERLRGYPKAQPRNTNPKIVTDIPEKKIIKET